LLQKLMKEYRAAFNTKDAELMTYLDAKVFDTDEPGFRALNPHFDGREGFGQRLQWPVYGKGAKLAFCMMEMASQIGGGASYSDFFKINEVHFLPGNVVLPLVPVFSSSRVTTLVTTLEKQGAPCPPSPPALHTHTHPPTPALPPEP